VEPADAPEADLAATQTALLEDYRVKQVAWSPDGSLLVIGTYHIYFHDAQTLEQVYVIDAVQWVNSIAFSPDGTVFASASHDGVKLWDVGGWGELRTLAGSDDTNCVAFSPDGTLLATATGSTVKLWDVTTGDELHTIPAGRLGLVAFSPDGQTLAAGGAGSQVVLWDTGDWSQRHILDSPSNMLAALAFAPDGKTLATAHTNDDAVRLWDVSDGRQVRVLSGHSIQIASVGFSPDGRLLAASSGVQVKLWDVAGGDDLQTLSGHSDQVESVAFSPDGARLATGATDVRLWELEWGAAAAEPTPVSAPSVPIATPVPLSERAISPENAGQVTLLDLLDSDWVNQIAWSPDGELLAICTYHIHFYDAQTLEQVYVIDSVQWPSSISFSPDGTLLAAAAHEGVELWEVGSWGNVLTLAGSQNTESVAFSPSGRLLATATGSTVKLWDVTTGRPARRGPWPSRPMVRRWPPQGV
jgi:WD40 repeat protein